MRAEWLAAAAIPVIVKPLSNSPTQFDRIGTRFDNAARLAEAGVPLIITTWDTHNARNLRFEAGNAVRFGLPWDAALRAVTITPAELLGIDASHGTLEAGKRANIVVWTGDPFELASAPAHVLIGGEEVPNDSRQLRLLARYLNLGDKRVQYRGK